MWPSSSRREGTRESTDTGRRRRDSRRTRETAHTTDETTRRDEQTNSPEGTRCCVAGSAVLTGTAAAKGGKKGGGGNDDANNYGNGNALGKFLNEKALYKESPVWDGGVADRTGQSEVDVLWGGLTEVINPETGEPFLGPWGVDPRAVKVSPGTEVSWTWYGGPGAIDVHHLVSYFDPPYEERFELPPEFGGSDDGDDDHDHEHPGGDDEFYVKEDFGESFSYTFDDVGTYFYFCIPHGFPSGERIELPDGRIVDPPNLFGQRGAVKVVDD